MLCRPQPPHAPLLCYPPSSLGHPDRCPKRYDDEYRKSRWLRHWHYAYRQMQRAEALMQHAYALMQRPVGLMQRSEELMEHFVELMQRAEALMKYFLRGGRIWVSFHSALNNSSISTILRALHSPLAGGDACAALAGEACAALGRKPAAFSRSSGVCRKNGSGSTTSLR